MGQTYLVLWLTTAGSFTGLGFVRDGHLLTGWAVGAMYWTMLYKINGDGTLDGEWVSSSMANLGAMGWDKVTDGVPGQLEGVYQRQGVLPGTNNRYRTTLTIRTVGQTYHLFGSPRDALQGIGVRVNDWLIVSWGYSEAYGVMDYALEGDKIEGRWAIRSQGILARETLLKVC